MSLILTSVPHPFAFRLIPVCVPLLVLDIAWILVDKTCLFELDPSAFCFRVHLAWLFERSGHCGSRLNRVLRTFFSSARPPRFSRWASLCSPGRRDWMAEPPRLAPFDLDEQRLYSKPPRRQSSAPCLPRCQVQPYAPSLWHLVLASEELQALRVRTFEMILRP